MELIVAIDQHCAIGDSAGGSIVWNVPEDLAHFRRVTDGHIVIMGRKTFDSLKAPLSNRINIVLTRRFISVSDTETSANNAQVIYTGMDGLFDVIDKVKTPFQKVFVIGGAEIYSLLFPYVNIVHMTLIGHCGPAGDTLLPHEIMDKISEKNVFSMEYESLTFESRIRPNTYEFMRFERN